MKYVPAVLSRQISRQALVARKNSPTILFAAGVAGVISTTVMACRATLKVEGVLDDLSHDLADAERILKHSDNQKDKVSNSLRIKYGVEIAKLYAPSIGLGVVSIGCLTGSHKILTRRNVAITTAYSSLVQSFSEYRQHVADELGPEREAEFRHGVDVTVEEDEHGKKTLKKSAGLRAEYSRLFARGNAKWEPNPEHNAFFLQAQQEYANTRLRANGHLLLNDVLVALGYPRTPVGAIVGWLYEKGTGDNYVDFGIGEWPDAQDFVRGTEGGILLDFNVDGVIYEEI